MRREIDLRRDYDEKSFDALKGLYEKYGESITEVSAPTAIFILGKEIQRPYKFCIANEDGLCLDDELKLEILVSTLEKEYLNSIGIL